MLSFRMCPVCESYMADKPAVFCKILIIGNFIFATPKTLKYSILAQKKFICGGFALHNS